MQNQMFSKRLFNWGENRRGWGLGILTPVPRLAIVFLIDVLFILINNLVGAAILEISFGGSHLWILSAVLQYYPFSTYGRQPDLGRVHDQFGGIRPGFDDRHAAVWRDADFICMVICNPAS